MEELSGSGEIAEFLGMAVGFRSDASLDELPKGDNVVTTRAYFSATRGDKRRDRGWAVGVILTRPENLELRSTESFARYQSISAHCILVMAEFLRGISWILLIEADYFSFAEPDGNWIANS